MGVVAVNVAGIRKPRRPALRSVTAARRIAPPTLELRVVPEQLLALPRILLVVPAALLALQGLHRILRGLLAPAIFLIPA
jgi:hypothetical protein